VYRLGWGAGYLRSLGGVIPLGIALTEAGRQSLKHAYRLVTGNSKHATQSPELLQKFSDQQVSRVDPTPVQAPHPDQYTPDENGGRNLFLGDTQVRVQAGLYNYKKIYEQIKDNSELQEIIQKNGSDQPHMLPGLTISRVTDDAGKRYTGVSQSDAHGATVTTYVQDVKPQRVNVLGDTLKNSELVGVQSVQQGDTGGDDPPLPPYSPRRTAPSAAASPTIVQGASHQLSALAEQSTIDSWRQARSDAENAKSDGNAVMAALHHGSSAADRNPEPAIKALYNRIYVAGRTGHDQESSDSLKHAALAIINIVNNPESSFTVREKSLTLLDDISKMKDRAPEASRIAACGVQNLANSPPRPTDREDEKVALPAMTRKILENLTQNERLCMRAAAKQGQNAIVRPLSKQSQKEIIKSAGSSRATTNSLLSQNSVRDPVR
jgi:hypothetical protein